MFPPAIGPCFSPPKVPNIGTVRTCGPDNTSVLHGISFSAFGFVNQNVLVGVPFWQMESSRRCWRKRSPEAIVVFVRGHGSHAVELSRSRRRFQRRQKSVRMGRSSADTVGRLIRQATALLRRCSDTRQEVARYLCGETSHIQTSGEFRRPPQLNGRFASRWQCQSGCRMLADFSGVISHNPFGTNFLLDDHTLGGVREFSYPRFPAVGFSPNLGSGITDAPQPLLYNPRQIQQPRRIV